MRKTVDILCNYYAGCPILKYSSKVQIPEKKLSIVLWRLRDTSHPITDNLSLLDRVTLAVSPDSSLCAKLS